MNRRASVPRPRAEGVAIPTAEGMLGAPLYEAIARGLLDMGDPDEWDLLPSMGLLYTDGERVGMAVELPIPRKVWIGLEHPLHVVRWLARTMSEDPDRPNFDKGPSLAAIWLVAEAWMRRVDPDEDDDHPCPADDPDRIEQRLALVVGPESNGYASIDRGSEDVVMHYDADGRLVAALRGLLAVMTG